MQATGAFINIPVNDISHARTFWHETGFSFEEEFSNEQAVCLILQPGQLYAMLVVPPLFESFVSCPVAEKGAEVLLGIQLPSREAVDRVVERAMMAGARRWKDPVDQGWMYYDSFLDPDGHHWEWVCIAPVQKDVDV